MHARTCTRAQTNQVTCGGESDYERSEAACTAIASTAWKEFGGVVEFVLLLLIILKYARAPAASGNEHGFGAECRNIF